MSLNWIQAFVEAQAAELDAARNTQVAYAHDLKNFREWLEAQGSCLNIATREDIEAYLVHCDGQGLAQATRSRRLSAIRQLYRFVFEEGWRNDNPAIQIKGPRRAKQLPTTLTINEVDRLLDTARKHGRAERTGFAMPASWSFSTPQACGSANWSRCLLRRRAATPQCC